MSFDRYDQAEREAVAAIAREGICPLVSRELDVLSLVAEGKIYKQVGAELGIAASTVRAYMFNVIGKLGVADRAQAVILAWSQGWVETAIPGWPRIMRPGGSPTHEVQCEAGAV